MNLNFKNAINRTPQNIPPIWCMRQAGRYHQHYQDLRKKYSFMDLCKNPKLAAQTAMGPIEDFDFDVAILFSDILFPLDVLNMGLKFEDKSGPSLSWYLNKDNINKLNLPGVSQIEDKLSFQKEALIETRKTLPNNKSLIGFIGGPWTLFTYATCGSHKGSLIEAKKNISLFTPFCQDYLIPLLNKNIALQLEGGAEVIFIFDTAIGELSSAHFQKLVIPQLKELTSSYPKKIAYYGKNLLPSFYQHDFFLKENNFIGHGFDQRWNLPECFSLFNSGFIQGNFDQNLLFLNKKEFEKELIDYLHNIKKIDLDKRIGWVFGLGHGILPKTPQENVKNLVKITRNFLK